MVMGEDLFTNFDLEDYPSTFLSMDSNSVAASSQNESDRGMNRQMDLQPPDINLPLSVECSLPPPAPPLQSQHPWNDTFDLLEVHLGPGPPSVHQPERAVEVPKAGRKCAKRLDCVWGAWFFFSFYFKPIFKDKSKCNMVLDSHGVSEFAKSDLELDAFLVQHDMENMYMWAFKERPENALGKMQLRSYMNGHSRLGDRPFPFSVEKGFLRSHRMQRKHYRGLSNPQCLHGIEPVPCPNLMGVDEEDKKKWMELTGRDLNFIIPPEAKDFSSWRNLPNTDFELERPIPSAKNPPSKKLLNGSGLNLSTQASIHANGTVMDLPATGSKKGKEICLNGTDEDRGKKRKEICLNGPDADQFSTGHPGTAPWMSEITGVVREVSGPVTAAKTIYEDDEGYLILVTLPFADPSEVKVHWFNSPTHGFVKISAISSAGMPFIERNGRTFRLTDPYPEHCPGEFKREIPLPTLIAGGSQLEAYFDKTKTVLEIKVPKLCTEAEEHEVPVCLRPMTDFTLG